MAVLLEDAGGAPLVSPGASLGTVGSQSEQQHGRLPLSLSASFPLRPP